MIAITNLKDQPIRHIPEHEGEIYGYHRAFGFISESGLKSRKILRDRSGLREKPVTKADWLCRFRFAAGVPLNVSDCSIVASGEQKWRLSSPAGEYFLTDASKLAPVVVNEVSVSHESAIPRYATGILLSLLVVFGYVVSRKNDDLDKAEKLQQLLESQKTVVIQKVKVATSEHQEAKVVQKKPKNPGAAVQAKLGFLSLLGQKNLRDAMGGMPTPAKHTTAGAGFGGSAGSGGELLTGLGEGVKHTTVGNTGVAGLGGIGNAGAGGGKGGFGQAYVGSGGTGGGRVLSNVGLSDDVELEGGLDKEVIQATIAKYLNQVRACYERGLRQKPGLQGQVTLDFQINAEGHLTYAKVRTSSLDNPSVENCVAHVVMNWQFPKPVGGTLVKVNYPFVFKPANYM